MNVPPSVGAVLSLKLATMTELTTTLSLEDVHDLLEIARVDAHNQWVINEATKDRRNK